MPKVIVTDKDTTLMNVVTTVLPETSAILCYFHVGRNVRVKCITYYKVKLKVVKVDEKEMVVKEVKTSDIVDAIMRACDDVVESSTQDSCASVVMQFRDACKKNSKFLDYVQSTILYIVKEKTVTAWTNSV